VEFVSADMLVEANKRTKIAHNSWLAKYGELETKFGISEGTIKELRRENEDVKGAHDRLKENLRVKEMLSVRHATWIKRLEEDEGELVMRVDGQAIRIKSLKADKGVLEMTVEDQRAENEDLKKQIRTLKASVRESLRAVESQLND